jgi:hypothetical protein
MLMHMIGLLFLTYAVVLPLVLAFAILHGIAWACAGRSCRQSAPTTSAAAPSA